MIDQRQRLECTSLTYTNGQSAPNSGDLFVLTRPSEITEGRAVLHSNASFPDDLREVEVAKIDSRGVTMLGSFVVSPLIGHGDRRRALISLKSR